jgi:BolA protein
MSEITSNPGGRAERLRSILTTHLAPLELEIVDDSARHAGHSGAQAGGQTHFNVRIVSAAFTGVSRVQRSRLVHDLLVAEFTDGLHALSLTLRTPTEVSKVA